MGDLIHKLPIDDTPVMMEERENFIMLFPEEDQSTDVVYSNSAPIKNVQNKLKKEVAGIFVFIIVFFLLNLPFVKDIVQEYIPMCNKSWILTNFVQSIIFALVLWIVMNAKYSRV